MCVGGILMSTIATSGSRQPDRAQELLAVRRLGDDVEAGIGEQPREPFAQEHLVVGDHDRAWELRANRRATGRCPLDGELAVERADAVLEVDEVVVQRAGAVDLDPQPPVRDGRRAP